jgi:hypothetical protein
MTKKNENSMLIGLMLSKQIGCSIEYEEKKFIISNINYDAETSIFTLDIKEENSEEIKQIKLSQL